MVEMDAGQLIGAITQLQLLHRQGRFAIPLRMKLLPGGLRRKGMAQDVSDVYACLQPLLKVDLNRVSRGAELPPHAAGQLYAFYRALVQLRMASEAGKAERAQELLDALAEELDVVDASESGAAREEGLAAELQAPSWLRLYRVLMPAAEEQLAKTRLLAQFLSQWETSADDPRAVALLTLLARQPAGQPARAALEKLVEVGSDYPQRWALLLGEPMCDCLLRHFDAAGQQRLLVDWIALLTTSEREAEIRGELLERWLRELSAPRDLAAAVGGLADLTRQTGAVSPEILQALRLRGSVSALPILHCLRSDDGTFASPDAQFLIGRLLQAHDVAGQPAFVRFCRRVAHVELTVGLRTSLSDRLLPNSKWKQALINQAFPVDGLNKQLRASTDYHAELYYLLLLALQQFDGATLGEVTRALSLIDLAIRQNKIDPRHLALLLRDMKRDPGAGLLTLVDEERIDAKSQGDPELFLLYMNLCLISRTSERVESLDLDNLSGTLRKLKIRDARGRE